MKRYKFLVLPLVLVVAVTSCKKSAFVKDNINPGTIATVDPAAQFMYACTHFPNDNEYFYDFYRDIMPWLQYTTGGAGNTAGFEAPASSHFNNRYNNFYTNVGLALADVPHLVEALDSSERPGRIDELAIASIFKAYYAWYVSDITGDIPYSQAFEARYGGTLTPVYDIQQNLFDSLDLQVKSAVATLESTSITTQVLYGGNDLFYGGLSSSAEVAAWIKAGNALRLKMATRLIKRNPSAVTAIAQQVFADANQMASNADGWVLFVGPNFADWKGNYSPTTFLAARSLVNFMNKYNDPREPAFYRPANGVYVGSTSSPDSAATPFWQAVYTNGTLVSTLQHRLWTPNYDEGDGLGLGTGEGFYPVITYAEYCFIRADLAARGLTTDNASMWYTNGVTASIQFYDQQATAAKVAGYVSVDTSQIGIYIRQKDIAFDPTRATEQIACQAHIEFFKNPAEGWDWWKRTGYPNTTSIVAWEPLIDNGTAAALARRAPLSPLPSSDANYANQQAAFKDMSSDPNWGATPDNSFGRVWWDMP